MELKKIPCCLCGSNDSKTLYHGVDRLHGLEGSFKYVRCTNCGLSYMNPQIPFEHLGQFYPEDYKPHIAKQKPKNLKKKPPLPDILDAQIKPSWKVLDVGCGSGSFLFRMKNSYNCSVNGLDVSASAVAAAKNTFDLDLFQGTIDQAPFPDGSFDLVTAFSYIEHVNNPAQVIQKMYKLVKNNGYLILKTPNIASLPAKLFRSKWYSLDCPRHLFLFSPKTLISLLVKSGFKVLDFKFTKTSKGLRESLQYYFFGDNVAPERRDKISKSKFVQTLTSPLARILALLKCSDVMTVFAQKSES